MGDTVTEISPSAQSWMGTFDPEEDHLLDYFLSGDHTESNGNNNGNNQEVSTYQAQNASSMTRALTTEVNFRGSNSTPSMSSARGLPLHRHSSGVGNGNGNAMEDNSYSRGLEPSTPNVEFYASVSSSSSQRKPQNHSSISQPTASSQQDNMNATNVNVNGHGYIPSFQTQSNHHHISNYPGVAASSASSSSSSLSLQGMKSSTPILHVHQQFQSQGQQQFNVNAAAAAGQGSVSGQYQGTNTNVNIVQNNVGNMGNVSLGNMGTNLSPSPISPAFMATNEELMLPPVTRYGSASVSTSSKLQQNGNIHPAMTLNSVVQTQTPNLPASIAQQQWANANANASAKNNGHTQIHTQYPQPQVTSTTTNITSSTKSTQNHNQMAALPAWLQHMNNVASMAGQATAQSQAVAQQVQPQTANVSQTSLAPQQQQQHPQHPNMFAAQQLGSATAGGPLHPHQQLYPGSTNASNIVGFPMSHMQHSFGFGSKESAGGETREKRERRLARNRESARQSRRRKKDLLIKTNAKVNQLHCDIEYERRKKVDAMESALVADKMLILNDIFRQQSYNGHSALSTEKLVFAVRNGGPNTVERRAAITFQYNSLRQLLVPCYRKFLLSLSLKEGDFFTEAKDARLQAQTTTGRVSSKQVGEELTKGGTEKSKRESTHQTLTCRADNKELFWPLLCYELSIGIDQEEKFLQGFEAMREQPLPNLRDNISVAAKLVSNIRDGILSHCKTSSNLNELHLLQILTPAQSIRFLEWQLRNKIRCQKLLAKQMFDELSPSDETFLGGGYGNNDQSFLPKTKSDHSLNEVCEKLTEAVNIKMHDN